MCEIENGFAHHLGHDDGDDGDDGDDDDDDGDDGDDGYCLVHLFEMMEQKRADVLRTPGLLW